MKTMNNFLPHYISQLKLYHYGRVCCFKQFYGTDVSADIKYKNQNKRQKMLVYAKRNTFVDWKKIKLIAGKGGNGCVSFMNARSHKGGPHGGDGGAGGDICVVADENLTQLSHLNNHFRAGKGGNGISSFKRGKRGKGITFAVPVGTTITNIDTEEVLAELMENGEHFTLLRGGLGGLGNVHFKAADHVRPREFSNGEDGEECVVEVELKSIADIGMVGFPNAGKSTLLRAVSHALPKVADYPFTTLQPNIGVIQYNDNVNISVADIPGLVEGAHRDKGLGHVFLRHVERCHALIYVVDVVTDNALSQLNILKDELEKYQTDLSSLPALFVANKLDLLSGHEEIIKEIEGKIDMPVVGISAKYCYNIDRLKDMIFNLKFP